MAFAAAVPAIISLVSTAASTAVAMVGAKQQAGAQAQAANYQAAVASNNAKMMADNANYQRQKGAQEVYAQDLKNRATRGAIAAAQGASGFDMSSGSLVDIRGSAAELGRLDTLTTENNSERKARDFDIAGRNQEAQAGLYSMTAGNAQTAGNLNMFSSLLGGVESLGSKFYDFKKAGAL